MLTVYIPDASPITVPDRGQSVEEIRRALVAAGYTQLETATGRKDGNVVRFERPQGGDKGSL
ncbi:MAG TPA: hypothetical protein VEI97_19620 [bacterium]|nr:hypothetical protein [bacterium]